MSYRVLYVDDDDDIREIALISLELDPGFEVRGCSSGEEAIRELQSWEPDIILLDVMMPVLDGPATFERMKELPTAGLPPVVFCTARYQERDVQSYIALGAAGVISKPFDPMSLADNIKKFLK